MAQEEGQLYEEDPRHYHVTQDEEDSSVPGGDAARTGTPAETLGPSLSNFLCGCLEILFFPCHHIKRLAGVDS